METIELVDAVGGAAAESGQVKVASPGAARNQLALDLMQQDKEKEEERTNMAQRMKPLYRPGEIPCHVKCCDCLYKCGRCVCLSCPCRWFRRLTCGLVSGWCSKECGYLAKSPRIVHGFTALSMILILLSFISAGVGYMQVTTKIPETGETKVLGEIRDIVGVMALWSTYPPGFCVFVLANAVPSALALSQRRLFFWLPFLALAGIGYLGMGGYNAFLQRNVIQKALDRVDQ